MVKKYKKLIFQIIFFGIVGVTTLVIDILVTVFLFEVVGLPAYLSAGLGFLSGFFFNFPMNRHKVFRHTPQDRFGIKTQVTMFMALSGFNLLVNGGITELLVSLEIAPIAIAKILITILIAIWNFVLFKLLIFSKVSE